MPVPESNITTLIEGEDVEVDFDTLTYMMILTTVQRQNHLQFILCLQLFMLQEFRDSLQTYSY